MENNERINILNYSHTDRRGSNSFIGLIKTVFFGMFFIGLFVFILNSSNKYIKNYQEELKNQHLRNLEDIEVEWHIEFFNQKNSKNKSANDFKSNDSLLYEKIKHFESKVKKENFQNNFENSTDKETEVIIADSFFANRTLMLRNSSKGKNVNSENFNNRKNEIEANKYFLGKEKFEKGKNLNYDADKDKGFYAHKRTNNNISNYYFEYINKFREQKSIKNNSNSFDRNKESNKNHIINQDENRISNSSDSKFNESEIKDFDSNAKDEVTNLYYYLNYIDNLTYANKNYHDYKEDIINPSSDVTGEKPKTHRSLLGIY
jgi:hypothetical protein